MSLIREGCDSLGKTFLTSPVGNHWVTDGLRVNSSPVKVGLIIFPLFLLGNIAHDSSGGLCYSSCSSCFSISYIYIYLYFITCSSGFSNYFYPFYSFYSTYSLYSYLYSFYSSFSSYFILPLYTPESLQTDKRDWKTLNFLRNISLFSI